MREAEIERWGKSICVQRNACVKIGLYRSESCPAKLGNVAHQSILVSAKPETCRKPDGMSVDVKSRRWSKRAFQRRSSEVEVRLHHTSLSGSQGHSCVDGPKSPTSSRRRSSSIAVARPTPDLHRLFSRKNDWSLTCIIRLTCVRQSICPTNAQK